MQIPYQDESEASKKDKQNDKIELINWTIACTPV